MPFSVAPSTLESLEWHRVIALLRKGCRTPQGHLRVEESDPLALFEEDEAGVRARIQETTEAVAILDAGAMPPMAGCAELRRTLASAAQGEILEASELLEIRTTLEATHSTRHFFERRSDDAILLASLAARIEPLSELEAEIGRCLDTSGDVRDAASPKLAQARREVRSLTTDLKRRIERSLSHADITPHLSDQFYTVRGGRFVLPVKADSKGRVRGIVHDASRSGTTLFIEPEGMVELNNRHKQAELTVEREILRVLRELSAGVARHAAVFGDNLAILGELDLAIARGVFAREIEAVEPVIEREGIYDLPGLRHPLIPAEECVANDLRVGSDFFVLILSGPNAGGKTVALKAFALAALFVRAGLHVPANPGARVDLADVVLADIGDHQDIQESLSTFSAAMASLADILREARPNTFVCLDEVGVGTDPSEGAAIAQSALEALADSGARVVTTTHYNLLKEMAEVDGRFENASVEFDPETMAPTYRVRIGSPGVSSATTVAARMGMPQGVLDRAAALLDREDRQLDQMLSELAASRAMLESEKTAAQRLRLESEQSREEYRLKLARLQERRDKLFAEMRRDLDASFRDAHSEVARIIAELQRAPSSKRAASARDRLEDLRDDTARSQSEDGLVPETVPVESVIAPVDWPRARVGDAVLAPGGGLATLLSLPDRRGRVSVQVGSAKLSLLRERLGAISDARNARGESVEGSRSGTSPASKNGSRRDRGPKDEQHTPALGIGGILEVDLRGMRVDECLDRLDQALDLAAVEGRDEVRAIHGIGTGALRDAVRSHLPRSPYVIECVEASREDGGAGATRAILRKRESAG